MAARRVERPLASRPNEIWAMDFVSDALFNGKRFRALTVVDAYTRECLAIHADQGIKGEAVATVMERLTFRRGTAPAKIRVDNVLCWEAAAATGQQVSLRRSRSALMSFWSRWLPSSRKVLSAIANTGSIDLGGRGPHRP